MLRSREHLKHSPMREEYEKLMEMFKFPEFRTSIKATWIHTPRRPNPFYQKGPKMDAIKLDVDAIRERVLEQAVVVKHCGVLHVVAPLLKEVCVRGTWCSYYSLLTGDLVNLNGETHDWAIRPGDECDFSDNGEDWKTGGTFMRLNGDIFYNGSYPFIAKKGAAQDCYRFIRPVQTDPEKEARVKRIKNLEKELKELKQIEGME